jgi:tetratricopeptide (TPR) repeat protein
MRTLLSRSIQIDPSFHVALGVLVIFAIAQAFFATSYYVGRARANRVSAQAVTTTIAPAPATAPASVTAPAAAQPSVPPAAASSAPPQSIVDQLLREGKEFRERGDTTNALARFQEAMDSEPDNTGVLQETAQTYESIQMFDRANELWRKIKQISPSDSETYALADRRLKVGVPAPPAVEPGGAPAETDVPARKDVGGNADGPIMGISDVKTKETSDPEAETNLALEIGIKKQPGAVVDHNKVKILVFLYDVVNDKEIKLTDADVSNEWLTSKHDWSDTNPEVLLVRYVRAKTGGALSESSLSEAAAKVKPGQKGRGSKGSADIGQRKYLGYIVRVYYGDDLQAVQAEPARLLQQFPPSKNPSGR